MILNAASLALVGGGAVSAVLASATALQGSEILLRWDLASGSERQLELGRRCGSLFSAAGRGVGADLGRPLAALGRRAALRHAGDRRRGGAGLPVDRARGLRAGGGGGGHPGLAGRHRGVRLALRLRVAVQRRLAGLPAAALACFGALVAWSVVTSSVRM